MVAIGVSLHQALQARLLPEILAAGHEVVSRAATAEELGPILAERKVQFVLVSAARTHLTAGLLGACDAAGIRVVALAGSDLERRFAADLGLFEVLDAACGWPEIAQLLASGVTIPARVGTPASRRGTVIVVWGPAGAPGRTTLAVNIAAELAAHGHTVAVADADTYAAAVAPVLGILDEAPGFAAACRLFAGNSLTQSEFERVAARYSSPKGSFWALTGIPRSSRWPELTAERVTGTIDAARSWVEYLVVDTGFSLESDEEISSDLFAPRRNGATLAALRASDRVVAVGLGDPVGIARYLRSHGDLLEIIPDAAVSTVINRVRSSAVGMGPFAQVQATLARFGGIESPVLVPHDQAALDAAVLTGATLRDVAPKSPARASIRSFVEAAFLPSPAPARRPAALRLPRRARHPARRAAT